MSSSDSLDEIDQIMNEIEELQQSMATAQAQPAPSGNSSASPLDSETKVAQTAVLQSAPEVANDAMAEFSSGRTETSLEDALGDLKDDEPAGPNLIDKAIEAEATAIEASAVGEVANAGANGTEQNIDETISEIIDESVDESIDETIEEPLQMHELTKRRASGNSNPSAATQVPTLNVQLSGDMKLKLIYEFEGQDVIVSFSDGALKVELSDGTEFKIPVRRNPLKKTA